MPLEWRVDVLSLLKEHGYSTYRIRKEKLFAESTIQKLRNGELINWQDIESICRITGKQPGKLIWYVKEKKTDS